MQNNKINLLNEVASYYTQKLAEFGDTPRGVDWNGEESQIVRFEQLCKIIDPKKPNFSLNDLGCGYGALLNYLLDKNFQFSYLGIDISNEMISAARLRNIKHRNARFIWASRPHKISDYSVASGVFNVRLQGSDAEWYEYLQDMLDLLDRTSRLAFSFNCLTSYSDQTKKRNYLYYADPCQLFNFCKLRYSKQVSLLHDYGLYEFTILVKKE
ncbi:class I SAM-dependent methyltransferase [Polynucleobacter paneuropaeus]|nr:class I SAM-dependent methyltransferase [Polynucleobacter paneuropaeus]